MATALAIVIIVLALAVYVLLGQRGTQKGVRQVVQAFRDHKAFDPKRALPPEKLGIMPTGGWVSRNFGLRDYRPQGMQMLIREKIVLTSDGTKLYLDRDALDASRLKHFAHLD
jgi:hypothetical protein